MITEDNVLCIHFMQKETDFFSLFLVESFISLGNKLDELYNFEISD